MARFEQLYLASAAVSGQSGGGSHIIRVRSLCFPVSPWRRSTPTSTGFRRERDIVAPIPCYTGAPGVRAMPNMPSEITGFGPLFRKSGNVCAPAARPRKTFAPAAPCIQGQIRTTRPTTSRSASGLTFAQGSDATPVRMAPAFRFPFAAPVAPVVSRRMRLLAVAPTPGGWTAPHPIAAAVTAAGAIARRPAADPAPILTNSTKSQPKGRVL